MVAFSLNKGFGFVQYEETDHAKAAFRAQAAQAGPTGALVMDGRRITVRPAVNSSWSIDAYKTVVVDEKPSFTPKIWNTGATSGNINQSNMTQNRQNSIEATNDCEIIVLSRVLTNYAESIENRLRQAGLTVDLLFPNSEVPLGKVLGNISSRGCLYAILVTPLNEEHRSITVNILYGQPAEHRNMPVDDAILFIQKNFNAYKSSSNLSNGPAVIESLAGHRHTDAIQHLLRVLAENRTLTVLQYDTIIQYLQERREQQIKEELGDAAATMIPDKTEEQKLQEKILSILEKPSIAENMKSIEVDESAMTLTNGLEILMDSKVQRALDSLLNSCIGWK